MFSARNSNFTFNRKFNSKMDKIRVFFSPISGHFFRFSKKSREAIPLKQSHEVFYKKRCSQKLLKIHRKTPLETQSLFFKKSRCIYNFFLTKEIPTLAFSCQLSKMFKNIFFFRTPLDNYFWIFQMKIKLLKKKL